MAIGNDGRLLQVAHACLDVCAGVCPAKHFAHGLEGVGIKHYAPHTSGRAVFVPGWHHICHIMLASRGPPLPNGRSGWIVRLANTRTSWTMTPRRPKLHLHVAADCFSVCASMGVRCMLTGLRNSSSCSSALSAAQETSLRTWPHGSVGVRHHRQQLRQSHPRW